MTLSRHVHALIAFAAVASPLTLSSSGSAQDGNKPFPNVLLLVDTSGSMEWKVGNTDFPTCNAGNPTATNERSRWIDLVEALTGSFQGYSCFSQDRNSTLFRDEFILPPNHTPYDYGYINPYHRIISNGCVIGPGVLPPAGSPYEFPPKAVNTFPFLNGSVQRPPAAQLGTYAGCPAFSQIQDGILDVFKDKLRFGLMTFDSHTDEGTGFDGAGLEDYESGIEGHWSYFVDDAVTGQPIGCQTPFPQEVGARNPGAPPWEGRMVSFGEWDAPHNDAEQRNEWIQQVLLAQRPYGATPIAGLLHDARELLWVEPRAAADGSGVGRWFNAPKDDPTTLVADCRKTTIILLSDGEPNLDLRPSCEGGRCPYDKPEEIAQALLDDPPTPSQSVETIVIGFALETVTPHNGTPITCDEVTDDHCLDHNNDENRPVQACCTLNRIAAAGAPPEDGVAKKAYFPQTKAELRAVFSDILTRLSANISTRTSAEFANASRSTKGGGYQFNSGFTSQVGALWRGTLTRQRTECAADGTLVETSIDPTKGDDFIANASSGVGVARQLYTVISAGKPTDSVEEERNDLSVRPRLATDIDGVGLQQNGQLGGPWDAAGFQTTLSAVETGITANACPANDTTTCRNDILGYLTGLTASDGRTRCAVPGTAACQLVGAIYHSTPAAVDGRPSADLRDESYLAFVTQQESYRRPSMLYVSSVDGFLHGFRIAPYLGAEGGEITTKTNNLLWSFAPPAALRALQTQFDYVPATILDGSPIVVDVPARVNTNGDLVALERTAADAAAGTGTWRTILIQGFGKGVVGSGYFALDVTNPNQHSTLAPNPGPKFLWQLTKDKNEVPLFGQGGTPSVTTVYVEDPSDSNVKKEIVVALLPGGDLPQAVNTAVDGGEMVEPKDDTFAPRDEVRAYNGADLARSFTIVRLDNGEILRTFRAKDTTLPSLATTRTTIVDNLPAPITGIPRAYPSTTGAIADRAYVGDAEGRLWRIDLSSSDPSEWKMEVLFDLFWDKGFAEAEPIETPPVLSVDDEGNVTAIVSTGRQDFSLASQNTLNRIVSVTEMAVPADASNPIAGQKSLARLNWVETFTAGERVTGPISLHEGSVYFATGTPPQIGVGACVSATSRVWGLHFLKSQDVVDGIAPADPLSGGAPALLPAGATEYQKSFTSGGGIIYGVGIEYQPTCSESVPDYVGDAYAGLGAFRTTRNTTRGKAFLVYQVGGTTSTVNANGVGEVPFVRQELERPEKPAIIESWALVSE